MVTFTSARVFRIFESRLDVAHQLDSFCVEVFSSSGDRHRSSQPRKWPLLQTWNLHHAFASRSSRAPRLYRYIVKRRLILQNMSRFIMINSILVLRRLKKRFVIINFYPPFFCCHLFPLSFTSPQHHVIYIITLTKIIVYCRPTMVWE